MLAFTDIAAHISRESTNHVKVGSAGKLVMTLLMAVL
jgi:hypothetical protein